MKHELPKLPYANDALVPVMSAETLEYHYGKHHNAYVTKLNQLIEGTPFQEASLEEIIQKATGPIFNNGAQVWNHTFFWNCLTPKGKGKPSGALLGAIEKTFGSLEQFQERFQTAAVAQFGSGWAWLVKTPAGTLEIKTTSNAENPLRNGDKPLFTCDVWEHAYYIDYRNERPKFVASVWKIVNWDFVAQNYADQKLSKAG